MFDAQTSSLVALTARQLVRPDDDLVAAAVDDPDEHIISFGPMVDLLVDDGERRLASDDAARMVVAVPLVREFRIDDRSVPAKLERGARRHAQTVASEPWRFVGDHVNVWTGSVPRRALLSSVHGTFAMPDPGDGRKRGFRDALELESVDDRPLARRGDAGAVVSALDGSMLGILVCADEVGALAAPILRAVELLHLETLDAVRIEAHNASHGNVSFIEDYRAEEREHSRSWRRLGARLRKLQHAEAKKAPAKKNPDEMSFAEIAKKWRAAEELLGSR